MKKIYYLLSALLYAYTLSAENCVSVKQVKTDYKNNKVVVSITWSSSCTGDITNHRNTVWLFVDYRPITNGIKSTTWTRATISAASAGTVINSGSGKGVWIYGANTTQSATLTLSNMPSQYDWCAFATDYPPNAANYNNGVYTLRGTAPFVINSSQTVTGKNYSGGIINTITDATGCSGWIERDVPTTSGTCNPKSTLVKGYCRDLTADEAVKFVNCGYELEVKTGNQSLPAAWSTQLNCPSGWRPATQNELACMWKTAENPTKLAVNASYTTGETQWGGWDDTSCCAGCTGYKAYMTSNRCGDSCAGTCSITLDGCVGIYFSACQKMWPQQMNYSKCVR